MAPNTALALLGLALVVGCSGPNAPTPVAPTATHTPTDAGFYAPSDAQIAAPVVRDPELEAWNREARAGAVTETVHGVPVSDPFRALESESPLTRAWIARQSGRSAAYLGSRARAAMPERLRALLSIGVIRSPSTAGNRVFFLRREGAREQLSLMVSDKVSERPGAPGAPASWSAPRELVDPTHYGARGAIDWYSPSPRGRLVAFGVSQNGDERSTLYVIDTATGRLMEEAIEHAKWCRLAWLPDESGFYYTRYPREGEEGYDPAEPDSYWRRMFFHQLENRGRPPRASSGQRPSSGACPTPRPDCAVASPRARGTLDQLVFTGTSRTDAPDPWVSSDGRWLVVNYFIGWSRQDALLIDRRLRVPRGALPRAFAIAVGADLNTAMVHNGRVIVVTNRGAPKYRVVSVDAAYITRLQDPHHTPGPTPTPLGVGLVAPWQSMIAEGQHPIDAVTLAGGHLVVSSLENIAARVRIHSLTGAPEAEITLPGEGTVTGVDGSTDSPTVAFLYESFFTPPVLLAAELPRAAGGSALAPAMVAQVRTDFDSSRYELERQLVASRDGTPINVFYIHRRDWRRDGRQPVLLTGYGGFNISLTPSFTRDPLYWLERGGVYAVANLRGGAEFGEAWHQAGALANKPHVFEDFEAVIRWFGTGGVSHPSRIAIRGGSNGGLLMGAMLTRAPEAFRATVARVGLYDMVRFHRFPPAQIWTSELGSPENPDEFRYLYGYSPYHRVRECALPAAWIETADHDSRVHWAHSTKFAALLQSSQTGPLPIYFFMQQNVGHGAGTRLGDQVERYVREYTFIEDQLRLSSENP